MYPFDLIIHGVREIHPSQTRSGRKECEVNDANPQFFTVYQKERETGEEQALQDTETLSGAIHVAKDMPRGIGAHLIIPTILLKYL